jgi:ABC-2 type transport system ATP-binding protein
MAIVEIQGLTKSYGGAEPALDGVTLEIGEGITGLLGPNGAGKSTLLQCVIGLLAGWSGRVTVLGLDARRDGREIRRRVGFMPETDALLPGMQGIRAVRYLGELGGLPRAQALRRAHEMLHHVGLGEAIYRPVEEYSTGMRQRFKLAQALVHDPTILFLDEPTSGLDPAGRDEFLALIRDLAKSHGKHVVWSSHILPEVQKVADAVVILHRARYRGTFRLEDLRSAAGFYDVEIEGDAGPFEAAARRAGVSLQAASAEREPTTRRAAFSVWLPEGGGTPVLFAAAREGGVRLRRLTPRGEDLDDVFHRVLEAEPRD